MSKVIVIDDMKSYCNTVCAELVEMEIEAVACQTVKKALSSGPHKTEASTK